jgi:hypothetical protein
VSKIVGVKNAPSVVTLGFIALWCVQQQQSSSGSSSSTAAQTAPAAAVLRQVQQQRSVDAEHLMYGDTYGIPAGSVLTAGMVVTSCAFNCL